MNADTLRRAAKEMREQAEAAVLACGDEPWLFDYGYPGYDVRNSVGVKVSENSTEETAEHIASWHPAVALAVADLLDSIASFREHLLVEEGFFTPPEPDLVVALARAYLGEAS